MERVPKPRIGSGGKKILEKSLQKEIEIVSSGSYLTCVIR